MKNTHTISIETERLLLVPITMHYAEDLFQEFTSEITRYMSPQPTKDISGTKQFIQSSIEKMDAWKNYQAVILDKKTKEFLGCVGLHNIDEAILELWIRVKKSAHGKKIGREAVTGLETRAQKNLNFEYLFYPVDKDNIPSRKIAESLWWIVQKDINGNEIVQTEATIDPNRKINWVEYRIPKK